MSIYEYRGLDKLMIMEDLWEIWASHTHQIVKLNLCSPMWMNSSKCFSKSSPYAENDSVSNLRIIGLKGRSITLANGRFLHSLFSHSLDFHDLQFETDPLYHSQRHGAFVDTVTIYLFLLLTAERILQDWRCFFWFAWKQEGYLAFLDKTIAMQASERSALLDGRKWTRFI